LTKGTHVIKLAITGSYVNIDWLDLSDGTNGIANSLGFNTSDVKSYRIYNFKGAYMGMFKASDLTSLKKQMEKSDIKAGAYMVRSLDGHTNKIIEVKR
jgi:predicted transcriptional regulator YdeE